MPKKSKKGQNLPLARQKNLKNESKYPACALKKAKNLKKRLLKQENRQKNACFQCPKNPGHRYAKPGAKRPAHKAALPACAPAAAAPCFFPAKPQTTVKDQADHQSDKPRPPAGDPLQQTETARNAERL